MAHKHAVGDVKYRGVSFSYVQGTPVLRGINCTVKAGKRNAVVGPSGSGKSTLLSLLLRFHDPDSGAIFIDGHDIREYTQISVRAGIGVVVQETFLFYGTIRDNFRFINSDVTEEEIAAACRSAKRVSTLIKRTLEASGRHHCLLDIVLKDTHTVENHPERFDLWTRICGDLIEARA